MVPKQGGELRGPPFKADALLKLNFLINLQASFPFFHKNMSINTHTSGLL